MNEEIKKKISLTLKGRIMPLETRIKISLANRNPSIETRKKMSESHKGVNNNFYGKHHSDATKMKISLTKQLHPMSMEARIDLSKKRRGKNNSRFGIKHSDASRKKMSDAKKGTHPSDATRKKLCERTGNKNSFFGKKHSEKTINNLSGCLSANWLGGKSFEPYTWDFNDRFKESIKQRDGFSCQLCGKTSEQLKNNKKFLFVHHINYDKLLSVKENCVSLCGSCHIMTNHNREKWTTLFQSMLRDKYSYDYQNQKIVLTLNNWR